MEITNSMVFDANCYENIEALKHDMINFIEILSHNDYTCQVVQTADTLYEVWFNYCDVSLGGTYPRWITQNEWEDFRDYLRLKDDDLR